MNLIRLRQTLNHESHGGHDDTGHSALLTLVDTLDEMFLSLEEQEEWLRDGYPLSADQAHNLADQAIQTLLSALTGDTAFGEHYLLEALAEQAGRQHFINECMGWLTEQAAKQEESKQSTHGHPGIGCEVAHPGTMLPAGYSDGTEILELEDHPF